MKIKKLLFLSLFLIIGLFLFMPNSVNATDELNKMKIEMAEPNEGEKIPIYAKVVLSNDTSELVYENIELSWGKYDSEGNHIPLNITDNTLFEKNTKYRFDISEDSLDFIYKDCEDRGYLFTRATELYVNGVLIENEQMSFYEQVVWINGVETVNLEVDDLIVGKPLPSTIKYVIKTSTETKEIVVNCDWFLGDMQTQVEENALAKLDEEYIPTIKSSSIPNMEEFEELATKTDFRTKMYINGELMNLANGMPTMKAKNEVIKYKVIFDAEGGIFANGAKTYEVENWNNDEYNYDSIIKPTREGYTFTGYYTEKTGGTSLQLLMAEVGVDCDTTFYAQWEKSYTYKFMTGDSQKFTLNKIDEYNFKVDGDYKLFNNIVINSLELEKDVDYKVEEGSTVITFTEIGIAKLNTLEIGTYDVIVEYTNDKSVVGKLIIEEDKTIDDGTENIPSEDNEKTDKPNANESDKDNTEKDNIITDNKDTNKPTGNNPQTSDNISTFVIMLGIATMGIVITTKIRKHIKE